LVGRNLAVALTKTERRTTREHKSAYIREVRDEIDRHSTLYLFSYENMRSSKFKDVRLHFRGDGGNDKSSSSRIILGKNKLLQIALGRTPEEEYKDSLRHVAKRITGGSVGLLFTSRPHRDVENYFATLVEPDFARAGSVAKREVTISGADLQGVPVSMVEQFRKLGMPADIKDGRVVLRDGRNEYRICKEGETLSAEKCKLLVHFGVKLSEFRVLLVCRWSDGDFELFDNSRMDAGPS